MILSCGCQLGEFRGRLEWCRVSEAIGDLELRLAIGRVQGSAGMVSSERGKS